MILAKFARPVLFAWVPVALSAGLVGACGGGEESGAGGAATATSTSTTSAATSGSGGSRLPCGSSLDCPDTGSECILRVCAGGFCDTHEAPEGTPVGLPDGDCRGRVCDGQGSSDDVADDTDTPPSTDACVAMGCADGTPLEQPLTGPPCSDGGGIVCLDGACVECLTGESCASGICEASGACAAPACDDGVMNGTETDLDCGGSCSPCPDLAQCVVAEDCESGICGGGHCETPSCYDSVQNGDESDVDCGGTLCGPCLAGQHCNGPGDCQSVVCTGNVCQ